MLGSVCEGVGRVGVGRMGRMGVGVVSVAITLFLNLMSKLHIFL